MSKVKFTGKSEEDAIRKASEALSIDPDDVDYKIVSRASGLLGILGQTVTIEVTVGERGAEPKHFAPEPLPASAPVFTPAPKAAKEPAKETDHVEDDDVGNRIEPARPMAPPPLPQGGRRNRPIVQARESDLDEEHEEVVTDPAVFEEKMSKAKEVISQMLKIAGGEATVTVTPSKAEIHISITGELPRWLEGGRNRVMESMQFLANKIVNRFPPRHKVVLLTEGQKDVDERGQQIAAMAASLAEKVRTTGEPVWVVPMSPRDRRYLHMAINESYPDLVTNSVGDGAARRICISRKQ